MREGLGTRLGISGSFVRALHHNQHVDTLTRTYGVRVRAIHLGKNHFSSESDQCIGIILSYVGDFSRYAF